LEKRKSFLVARPRNIMIRIGHCVIAQAFDAICFSNYVSHATKQR
jgi:hypothetical protein